MESIRIGNDILIEWAILRDGEPEPLLGKKLEIAIIGRYKTLLVTDYIIEDNVLRFTYYGKDQHRCGSYTLVLYINKGEIGMSTIDYADVFCLVPRSFMTRGQSNNITVSTLKATSDVFIGGVKTSTVGSLENVAPSADMAEEGAVLTMGDDGIYIPDKSLPDNVTKLNGNVKRLSRNVDTLTNGVNSLVDDVDCLTDDVDILKNKVFPFTITFSGGGTYEIGSTADINLSWSYDRNIDMQELNGEKLANDIRSRKVTGVKINTTYTLRATAGNEALSKSVFAQFRLKKYYGVSTNNSITNEEVLGMTNTWAQRAQAATMFDCTGGKYVYYVIPTSIAAGIQFWIGGLQNDDWLSEVRNVTNKYGHVDSYTIFRLKNIQNGVLSIEFK